jgi:hypothetical protein
MAFALFCSCIVHLNRNAWELLSTIDTTLSLRDQKMAFALRNLSVLAYANGFTLWHYKSGADPLTAASETGYFADAADLLAPGDMLMLSTETGGKIATISGAGKSIALAPVS